MADEKDDQEEGFFDQLLENGLGDAHIKHPHHKHEEDAAEILEKDGLGDPEGETEPEEEDKDKESSEK